jgi:translation initiation factor IF-3
VKAKEIIIKNEKITHTSLRVVYSDPDTQKQEWKIMSRDDALTFAKSFGLDLVLMNQTCDPPVCKLVDVEQKRVEDIKKVKLRKASSTKAKVMKEVFISTCIDPHDMVTKVNRVKGFLADGHQVKVSVVASKADLEKNSLALDQSILKVIELSEDAVSTIQPTPSNSSMRKDFIMNPKKP